MITSHNEYLSKLGQIQRAITEEYYYPIPEAEKIYKIDLDTRQVEAPATLSVTEDNEAEILFFEVDRYFDKKDLAQTTCIINYVNASGEHFVYPIPCMDIITKAEENKILLPWVISSDVTWSAGTVKFAFKFYEINTGTLEFTYMLNTAVAQTRVLQGMQFNYVEATERAAADYVAGNWPTKHINYFIKVTNTAGHYRYQHASANYDNKQIYYLREEEFRISDGTKLEAIYAKLDEIKKNALKWVEI